MEKNEINHITTRISETKQTTLNVAGSIKVTVTNEGAKPVLVNGKPINPGKEYSFEAGQNTVFAEDFSIDFTDATDCEVYVTTYKYKC